MCLRVSTLDDARTFRRVRLLNDSRLRLFLPLSNSPSKTPKRIPWRKSWKSTRTNWKHGSPKCLLGEHCYRLANHAYKRRQMDIGATISVSCWNRIYVEVCFSLIWLNSIKYWENRLPQLPSCSINRQRRPACSTSYPLSMGWCDDWFMDSGSQTRPWSIQSIH